MILRTGRIECTSDEHAELFQQEFKTYLCKVQMLRKSPYTFQRTTNFPSNCVRRGEIRFDNSAKKFELNMEEILSQISNLMRKIDIIGKKCQNCALELENAVRTQVVRNQVDFLSKSQKIWKTIFFDKLVSRQTDLSIIECSFNKIAQKFTPKLQQFLAQIS